MQTDIKLTKLFPAHNKCWPAVPKEQDRVSGEEKVRPLRTEPSGLFQAFPSSVEDQRILQSLRSALGI